MNLFNLSKRTAFAVLLICLVSNFGVRESISCLVGLLYLVGAVLLFVKRGAILRHELLVTYQINHSFLNYVSVVILTFVLGFLLAPFAVLSGFCIGVYALCMDFYIRWRRIINFEVFNFREYDEQMHLYVCMLLYRVGYESFTPRLKRSQYPLLSETVGELSRRYGQVYLDHRLLMFEIRLRYSKGPTLKKVWHSRIVFQSKVKTDPFLSKKGPQDDVFACVPRYNFNWTITEANSYFLPLPPSYRERYHVEKGWPYHIIDRLSTVAVNKSTLRHVGATPQESAPVKKKELPVGNLVERMAKFVVEEDIELKDFTLGLFDTKKSLNPLARPFVPKVDVNKPFKVVLPKDSISNSDLLKETRYAFARGVLIWKLPEQRMPVKLVLKPRFYSFSSFRNWIHSESWNKSLELIEACKRDPKNKTKFVMGNAPAQILYYGSGNFNRATLAHLFNQSSVSISDYSKDHNVFEKPNFTLSDYFTPSNFEKLETFDSRKSLMFFGFPVYCKDDLQLVEFARNKALQRECEFFFSSPAKGGEQVLQRTIDTIAIRDPKFRLKETIKVVFQGGILSTPLRVQVPTDFNIKHTVSLPSYSDVAGAFGLNESQSRRLVNFGCLVTGLLTSTTWPNAVSLITMFVNSDPVVFEYCKGLLAKIATDVIVLQGGFFEHLSENVLRPLWNAVISSGVVALVSEYCTEIVSLVCPLISSVVVRLRAAIAKESAAAAAKSIVAAVAVVFERIKDCIMQRSLVPLWGIDWNPRLWIKEAIALQDYYPVMTVHPKCGPSAVDELAKLREKGLVSPMWIAPVSQAEYVRRLENHVQNGERMVSYFKGSPSIQSELLKNVKVLNGFGASVKMHAVGQADRVEPYMLFMHGQPGRGKTTLMKMLIKVIAARFSFDKGAVYSWQVNVNFQDGLDHVAWAIIMDDVDQSVAPPTAGIKTHCEEVVALVNNKPYPVEQADVALKGKITANPLFVGYLSNFHDARAHQLAMEPHAVLRRPKLYIHVDVKPEFANDSGGLCPIKAADADTHEMYILTVGRYLKYPETKLKHLGPTRVVSLAELCKTLLEEFDTHVKTQIVQLTKRANDGPMCPKCGLPTDKKCCLQEEVILQGRFNCTNEKILEMKHSLVSTFEGDEWLIGQKLAKCASAIVITGVGFVFLKSYLDKQETIMQGREGNANPGLVPPSWAKLDCVPPPSLPGFGRSTFTYADIVRCVQDSHCEVEGLIGDGRTLVVHGMILCQGILLVPTHVLKYDYIRITHGGVMWRAEVNSNSFLVVPSNPELAVFKCAALRGVPGILGKIPPSVDGSIHQFDEVHVLGSHLTYVAKLNQIKVQTGPRVLTTDVIATEGDCGLIYACRHNQAWKVTGMHYATNYITSPLGIAATQFTIAGLLSSVELSRLVESLVTMPEGVYIMMQSLGKFPDDVVVGSLGPYSEVVSAVNTLKTEVYLLGELTPKLSGSTMKTKLLKTLMYEDVQYLEERFCGQINYWRFPNFRGSMVDGVWESPFTNAFSSFTRGEPNADLLMLAICDYLSGIENLDLSGYRALSDDEVVTGIVGSTIHGVNMKTSVGPPFNCGKRSHLISTDEGSYMSPDLAVTIAEVEEILTYGIPSPLVICTLKDEPVKLDKKPRVFNVLPYAFNHVMKKYGAAYAAFIRANGDFFESAVGINMTSLECNSIVNCLKSVDPTLKRLYDNDVTKMDKSWLAEIYDGVSLVVYAICFAINVEPHYNRKMVLGLKHATYSIKNDLFRTFWNPSGNDKTVEMNGLYLSLGERMVYYKENPFTGDIVKVRIWFSTFFANPIPPLIPELNFRKNVALKTYGDDALKAMRIPPSKDYFKHWKDLTGLEVTDASKNKIDMIPKDITDVEFLKRKFVFDEELKSYVTPLSKKSMIRMLLFKRDSILTLTDHAATVISEFMREAVYHGSEFYEEMMQVVLKLVQTYHLTGNPCLELRAYSFWRQQLKENNFQTWTLREERPPARVEQGVVILQGLLSWLPSGLEELGKTKPPKIMSNLNSGEGSHVQPMEASSSEMSHGTGQITAETAQITRNLEDPTAAQLLPENPLADFFSRATKIASTTISNADVVGILSSFDPWQLFLSNTAVAEKVRNFSYINGSIQVIGVVTIPGAAYGRYVVTALPQGGVATNPISDTLRFHNCLQTDHYAMIDGSAAESVIFQLPFIWPYEFAATSAAIGTVPNGMWEIYLSCLQPLATSVAGGITTGSIQWYANLMDDYHLVVPHFQGKIKRNKAVDSLVPRKKKDDDWLKPSDVARKAGSVSKVLEMVPELAPFAEVGSMVANGAASILDFFGFTRTSDERTPIPITMRTVTNVAHCDGSDSSDTASLMMKSEISIDGRLAGFSGADCLANADLFDRWTLIARNGWATTDANDTLLFEIPVTPCYFDTVTNSQFPQLSPAAYYSLPFEYWRADMEYMFVIPVSSLHRGSLQFVWCPLGSAPTADPTNVSMNLIYDVKAGENLVLKLGYSREVPYLHCSLISPQTAIIPIGNTNGLLRVTVLNPLVAQVATANTTVSVFVRSKNVQFAQPRTHFTYLDVLNNAHLFNWRSDIVFQGTLGDEEGGVTEKTMVLVPPAPPVPGDTLFFGDMPMSVRALLQKPSQFGLVIPGPFDKPVGIFAQLSLTATVANGYPNTWQGYFANLYLGFACSERFKVFPGGDAWVAASREFLTASHIPALNTLAPMTFCGSNKGGEFNIPYYLPKKFTLARENITSGLGAQNMITSTDTNDDLIPFVFYYSYGPDIRATCFRQVPQITFRLDDINDGYFFSAG